MPLPKPNRNDESQSEWMERCMSNDTINAEFDERSQRAAVCMRLWRDAGKMSGTAQHKRLSFKDVRVGDGAEDNGWIEGYANVFGIVDHQDERVVKGAFAKTIKERVAAGRVKLMAVHLALGGDTPDVIGTVTEAKEDDRGLWIHGELAGTERTRETKRLVSEGHINHMSIGYRPLEWEFVNEGGKTIVELKEIALDEVTLTPLPANEESAITAAKTAAEAVSKLQAEAPDKGRFTEEQKARAKALVADLKQAKQGLAKLLKGDRPQTSDKDRLHRLRLESRRKRMALSFGFRTFGHDSKTAEHEPAWDDVDKARLPWKAYANTESLDRGEKASWMLPHHWIKGGGSLDADGVHTDGIMHLHEGGLKAAWKAAQEADDKTKAHLQAHRRALGWTEEE